MDFEIENVRTIEPRKSVYSLYLEREALPTRPGGVAATVVTPTRTYEVSRLDGEDGWTIDGESLANGLPVFFNGEGSRCTFVDTIADHELAAALDSAAEAVPA